VRPRSSSCLPRANQGGGVRGKTCTAVFGVGGWPPAMGYGDRIPSDVLALQACVERAGSAMACAFSSSAEFEAAVIRARRNAHGRRRAHRLAVYAGVLAGLLVIAFLMI